MPIIPNEKRITYYATVVGLLISLFTAYFAIDSHYAKAEEFKKLELRLEQKIVSDRSDSIQQRIWKLEDRYPDRKKAPPEVQDTWRNLEKELTSNNMMLRQSLGKGQTLK